MYRKLREVVLGIIGREEKKSKPITAPKNLDPYEIDKRLCKIKGLEHIKPLKQTAFMRMVDHAKNHVNKKMHPLEKIIRGCHEDSHMSTIVRDTEDEMLRVAMFNHRATKKGLADTQIEAVIEKSVKDRLTVKNKLKFEFVPEKQKNINMRSFLVYTNNPNRWKKVSMEVRDRFKNEEGNHVCQICGNELPTQCHEVWEYGFNEEGTPIMKMIGMEALCQFCHEIKHLNQQDGFKEEEYIDMLLQIYALRNEITIEKAHEEYKQELMFMEKKKDIKYQLDLSYAKDFDIADINDLIQSGKPFDCHSNEFQSFLKYVWKTLNNATTEPEELENIVYDKDRHKKDYSHVEFIESDNREDM